MVAMPARIERLKQRPWIAHMVRTVERYLSRLGSQFAAATTYFSVLAIVPIMMVAFSITGFVLTVVQPGLLDDVADAVAKGLGGADAATREKILKLVDNALSSFWTIGIVGLVVALYTGAIAVIYGSLFIINALLRLLERTVRHPFIQRGVKGFGMFLAE